MQEKRLVCEVESLHYTDKVKYDVVVVDELESVYHSFLSDTCHKGSGKNNYISNYMAFRQHFLKADKVFIMDAYLHKRTLKYLNLLDSNMQHNLIMRAPKFDLEKKEVRKLEVNNWIRNIVNDLKNGLKLYIFYPYKTGKGSVWGLSIENFKNKIMAMTDLSSNEFRVYHGETDSEVRRKLENVNEEWKQAKCVITNSSITVGVNYDNKNDFDKCYLSYADFILPRDIIQTSLRVRNFKYRNKNNEDVIFLCKFPSYRVKNGEFLNPVRLMNINIVDDECVPIELKEFNYMKKFLTDEYDAKCFQSVVEFMKMSGYRITSESGDKEVIKKFKEDFKNANFGKEDLWAYNNIKAIKEKEKNIKEENIKLDYKASTDDKLEVRKWYVDNMCYVKADTQISDS